MKLRAPATPIINIDPYFSIWTENSVLENTVHWTGKPNTMSGRVFVDGEEFHFLGFNENNIPEMTVENVEIDAFSTIITYANTAICLTAHFTSPTLVDDLYYASRPVTYCKVSYESLDGNSHTVAVKFTASEELVLEKKGCNTVVTAPVDIKGITAIKMGNANQNVLSRSDDYICIDWGYLYLGVNGDGKAYSSALDNMNAISVEADLNSDALFLFGYDDIYSIQYFGDNLKAYWRKDGKTIEQAIVEAANEYNTLLARCNAFSDKLKKDATQKGNEKYADMLLLSVRQIMAAHKLVVDKDGNNLYVSKECSSNGCAATVDVTYPSAPIFLLYNTELLKGMLRPIMRYAASDEWRFDFAPHDVGQYPLLNGQFYGVKRENGNTEIDKNMQMPVEECGNMIILFAAICDADNDVSFAKEHIDTISLWSKYLIKYGLDPENQLCTDDFAGHLAHNVNLSIKAIMGISAYSRILQRLGKNDEAQKMMNTAREYAASVIERAKNNDVSYRLAFDQPDTFSLKYNSVWDKLWGTNLFPQEFYDGEIARYKKEMLPYGVPLDSRKNYTKSDWLLWVASIADNQGDFDLLVDSLWNSYNQTADRAPMTDWYYCDSAKISMFRHRTVIGGLFMKLMF